MEEQDVIKALAALAQPHRLRVFRTLVGARPGGLTPTVLCDTLEIAPTSLSFHLKELLHAGLVTQERDGRHLIYRASVEHMNGVMAYLTAHCCQGLPCTPTPADPASAHCAC